MVKLAVFFCLLWGLGFAGRENKSQEQASARLPEAPGPVTLASCAGRFDVLNSQIRDSRIAPAKARKEVGALLSQIRQLYLQQYPGPGASKQAVFPVAGYDFKAIGGTHGEGYQPGKYNFYQGNKHLGHPAHDIFIRDKNQDVLDDKTGKKVPVLAMREGIVLAAAPQWEVGSELRGGVYIWIYNPRQDLLYYYAHNQQAFVKPGDLVKPGNRIAFLGRTGLNAYKKRSPTHLHLMALQVKSQGELIPLDLYLVLKAARKTGG